MIDQADSTQQVGINLAADHAAMEKFPTSQLSFSGTSVAPGSHNYATTAYDGAGAFSLNTDSFILSIQSLRLISTTGQNDVMNGSPVAAQIYGLHDIGSIHAQGTVDAHFAAAISYDGSSSAALDSHHELVALVQSHVVIDPSGMLFS